MRVLDLFCGGGGAAMGYHLAWPDAEIVGVDLVRQPDYPFTFELADAADYPFDGFDFIHGSPPCKRFTTARGDRHAGRLFDPYPDHLTPLLSRLADVDVPWVVENVPGAPMPAGSVRLCGSSFGLDVRRHRLFASNRPLTAPPCRHDLQAPGRFPSLENGRRLAGVRAAVVGVHGVQQYAGHYADAAAAMGIDWLTWPQLTQAIPPAYTEHLARQVGEQARDRGPSVVGMPTTATDLRYGRRGGGWLPAGYVPPTSEERHCPVCDGLLTCGQDVHASCSTPVPSLFDGDE